MIKRNFWFTLLLIGIIGFFNACENGSGNGESAIKEGNEIDIKGYKYIHHIKNGGALPQPTEYVEYHYSMSADDSLLTDSRDMNLLANMQLPPEHPQGKKPSQHQPVLAGIKMMSPGDSMTIKIPMDSLPQKPMGFSKYKYLKYEIAVVDIKTQAEVLEENREKAKKMQAQREADMAREEDVRASLLQTIQDYKLGKLDSQLEETASGLKYVLHEKGAGKMPKAGNPIKVHYYGVLPNGTQFDNSFKRGNPYFFTLGVGQVIKGWDEAVLLMPIGSKATIFLPPSLGYGEKGSPPVIPPNSDLIFYVESLYPY